MKGFVSFAKWTVAMLAFVLALWLPLVASVHYTESKRGKEVTEPNWITMSEARRLIRYHGTPGLKITDERVYIWRGSKWIQVVKRRLHEGLTAQGGAEPNSVRVLPQARRGEEVVPQGGELFRGPSERYQAKEIPGGILFRTGAAA